MVSLLLAMLLAALACIGGDDDRTEVATTATLMPMFSLLCRGKAVTEAVIKKHMGSGFNWEVATFETVFEMVFPKT